MIALLRMPGWMTWPRLGTGAAAVVALVTLTALSRAPVPVVTQRATSGHLAAATALPVPPVVEPEAAPPSFEEPFFPFLRGEDTARSVSVGDTSDGFLVNARRLEPDDTWGLLPSVVGRELDWGSEELVSLLMHAARALHSDSGTRLWVGNVARRGGGDIDYSVSHNSGRDADIAFAYLNRRGEPIDPPDLVPLGRDGVSRDRGYRLDAARTWRIVKALVTHDSARVQYLFLSEPLERLLLEHANKSGEPADLIQKAAAVMWQPKGSAAHDDHLHLRTYCSQRDVEGGCVNTGPVHEGIDLFEGARRTRIEACVKAAEADDDAEERRRAILRLALLDAHEQAEHIAARLDDEAPLVRATAATTLGKLGRGGRVVDNLVAHLRKEPEAAVRHALVDALRRFPGEAAGQALADVIAHPDRYGDDPDLRLAAIKAAALSDRLEPVDALLPLFDTGDIPLRAAAADAMRHITGHSFGAQWESPELGVAYRKRTAQRWRDWVAKNRGRPRDSWLTLGFTAAGYQVPMLQPHRAWELVRAAAGPAHTSHNAQRVLERLFHHRPAHNDSWSGYRACHYWRRWLERRNSLYHLGRAPERTRRACP